MAADGAFNATFPERASGQAARQPWTIDVRAFYPDGQSPGQTVAVDACVDGAALSAGGTGGSGSGPPAARRPVEDQGAPFGQVVRAGQAATLSFGGARLEIPAGALDADVRITIRPLQDNQVAALDEGMVNVVAEGRGYRMGPHGLSFKKPIKLALPYESDRFVAGMSEQDMGAYFFDQEIGHWRQVRTVRGDADHAILTAETTHFTDFIAATLASPDHPTADSFNPNSIKDIKLADPAAGVDLIQPPAAAPDGSAHLSYPLEVPPGRQGMRPDLRLTYNSDAGNGWLGMGWDVAVPIVRHGSSPLTNGTGAAYSWEITDKRGTHFIYGDPAGSSGTTVLSSPSGGAIAEWHLRSETDAFGNRVSYGYTVECGTLPGSAQMWTQLYPATIDYTSNGALPAIYHVRFFLDDSPTPVRRTSSPARASDF